MHIFDRFVNIIMETNNPTIFEFGTCDGQHTNIMCNILKHFGKKFKYYAFEADPRIIPAFKQVNQSHLNDINLVEAAVGNTNGEVIFNLSGGEEKREGHFKQVFYGSSSIRKPKKTLEFWPDMTFEETKVLSHKFDTFYEKSGVDIIDFIWADIQGAEIDLIENGQVALSKTKYLYTEYSDDELYEGEIGLNEIISKLPCKWSVVEDCGSDVLLKNDSLGGCN